jgi:hypothetical protein
LSFRFKKHYSRDEARALLPDVRKWLKRLGQLRGELEKSEGKLSKMMKPGRDLGGDSINNWVRTLAEMKIVFLEFMRREIQIKDLERGLIDFPAIIAGKEAFLCWEDGEDDIDFWHDLDSGYAGREKLD